VLPGSVSQLHLSASTALVSIRLGLPLQSCRTIYTSYNMAPWNIFVQTCDSDVFFSPLVILMRMLDRLFLYLYLLTYLADVCQLITTSGRRRFRSSNVTTCDGVRFQALVQVWTIAHSLLLDRVCGTAYLSIYVTLNILSWSFAGY